jgi:hypothetical protein
MKNLKEMIKVRYSPEDLVRLGNTADGGYVASVTALKAAHKLYTYGVGGHWFFEKDFVAKYPGRAAEMRDHTVDVKNTGAANLFFYKEALAPTEKSTTFDESRDVNMPVFLKLDVEGAEYPFFDSAKLNSYENVTGIICEFHNLHTQVGLTAFKKTVNRLQEYFDIIHVHGNNYGKLIIEEDFLFPQTPEISFINKNLANKNSKFQDISYPLAGLDFPNCKGRPDLQFKVFGAE